MAAPTVVTLAKNTNAAADQLQYGLPDWAVTDTESTGVAAAPIAGIANVQHYILGIIVTFGAAAGAAGTLTLSDGTITPITCGIESGRTAPLILSFPRPIPFGPGKTVTAQVSDLTSAVTVNMIGFSSPDQATYT